MENDGIEPTLHLFDLLQSSENIARLHICFREPLVPLLLLFFFEQNQFVLNACAG